MDRNQRADPLIQQTVMFKTRMKGLNSTGYGASRFSQVNPTEINGVSLIDDHSSSVLFTMGRAEIANRPFSTQGQNRDFGVAGPAAKKKNKAVTGRHSTLEPLAAKDMRTGRRTTGLK